MDSSPLARLSAEIRNDIYEQVFTSLSDELGIEGRRWLNLSAKNGRCYGHVDYKQAITIAQTCRQTRAEARLMFFARHCFTFYVEHKDVQFPFSFGPVVGYLRGIGPTALEALEQLHVSSNQLSRLRTMTFQREVVDGKTLISFSHFDCPMWFGPDEVIGAARFDPILNAYIDAGVPLRDVDGWLGWCAEDIKSHEMWYYWGQEPLDRYWSELWPSHAHLRLVVKHRVLELEDDLEIQERLRGLLETGRVD